MAELSFALGEVVFLGKRLHLPQRLMVMKPISAPSLPGCFAAKNLADGGQSCLSAMLRVSGIDIHAGVVLNSAATGGWGRRQGAGAGRSGAGGVSPQPRAPLHGDARPQGESDALGGRCDKNSNSQ